MNRPLSLTDDPILRLLWRIGIPSSIGMFFNTMFNFVDTYCAGLLNTNALAALSLSFPIFFTLFAMGSGLAQGTTALLLCGSLLPLSLVLDWGPGNDKIPAKELMGKASRATLSAKL
jgi:hypothetical protein